MSHPIYSSSYSDLASDLIHKESHLVVWSFLVNPGSHLRILLHLVNSKSHVVTKLYISYLQSHGVYYYQLDVFDAKFDCVSIHPILDLILHDVILTVDYFSDVILCN